MRFVATRSSKRSVAGVAAVRAAEPAARDEGVDGPELLGGAGERLLDLAAVADVAADDVRRLLEHRSCRLEPVAVAGEQRQRRPVPVEPAGDRTSDPAFRHR